MERLEWLEWTGCCFAVACGLPPAGPCVAAAAPPSAPPDTTRRLQDEPARTARTQPSSSICPPSRPFASLRRCLSFCQRSRPLTNLLSAASHSLSLIPPTPLPTAALRRACSRPLGPPCRAIDLLLPRPPPSLPPTNTHHNQPTCAASSATSTTWWRRTGSSSSTPSSMVRGSNRRTRARNPS